jgi:hypothetical protein
MKSKRNQTGIFVQHVREKSERVRSITRRSCTRTDAKPATKELWRQGKMGVIEFFGGKKPSDITPGDADNDKLHLIGKKLAPKSEAASVRIASSSFARHQEFSGKRGVAKRCDARSGWGGIRTPVTVSRKAVFKTAALDHSATHPSLCRV